MSARTYRKHDVCAFRFTGAKWAEFSNFWPLPTPIAAGPWTFATSEHLYQAAKFGGLPDVQASIAAADTARTAAAIGRLPNQGIDPHWNARRVDVMRWVLRLKRETNPAEIDAVLARTTDRSIVEVSIHDAYWGAKPVRDRYEGCNVLGRLWMELRQQIREHDPAAVSGAWIERLRIGRLTQAPQTVERP